MSQSTGESESSLHQIIGMIRAGSIVFLLLHFYYYTYSVFRDQGFTSHLGDLLLTALARTGLFDHFLVSKTASLLLLVVALLGARGKKDPEYTPKEGLLIAGAGLLLYFGSAAVLYLGFSAEHIALFYILLCSAGYLLLIRGGNYFSRIIWRKAKPDIFNRLHESFPQEERLIANSQSFNLPAIYQYKGEVRPSYLNFVNLYRGLLLLGSSGSGKTWYVLENLIKQQIAHGYSMLLYDFKYDDLSKIAYNYFLAYRHQFPGQPGFYNIAFDDLNRSHRCNCLSASTMADISDAGESAATILLGLNMDWIGKRGDFFVESSIGFVTVLIWFLCLYQNGKYCSWPHVIELARIPYKKLFSVLRAEPLILAQISPFVNAFIAGAADQLEGQIATTNISLSKLSSPRIYWVLTGDDFTLDLNNPQSPKVLTLGSNPQRAGAYGPLISAYINTINRLANAKGRVPFSEILEECSTITVHTIDKTLATGRSNLMAITLCFQNASQIRLAYGREFADVILNSCGNIICGQASGETARLVAERFGKTMQKRESFTISSADTSINQSQHLEYSIPASRISSLSSGEFVGMVADTPEQPIELKTFCCRIVNDPVAIA
jgi:YWFCY protein/TraM recognition site of TraD and TraG